MPKVKRSAGSINNPLLELQPQGVESTGFSWVYTRTVITPLRTLFLQISQVIEIHLQKSVRHKQPFFLQFVPMSIRINY